MTIEELLGCDASSLEAMSDVELTAHLEPYLRYTRPESPDAVYKEVGGAKVRTKKMTDVQQMLLSLPIAKRQQLEQMSKAQGIDLEELMGL